MTEWHGSSPSRLLVVAGKGGVGKTTVAAATALAADALGRRCLVASLDRAHSLGDVLGQPLGPAPTPIPGARHLQAVEVDAQVELERNWASLGGFLGRFLSYLGVGGAVAEEMAILPGLEELLVLARLEEALDDDRFDLVVADFAPTASSLRYLSFPDLMAGALGKWIEWDRRLAQFLRPLEGRYIHMPLPDDAVYTALRSMSARLGRLRGLLADPERSAVRLVMTPESVVLEETRRAFTYLGLFGFGVDAVVVNRVLPEGADLGYLRAWADVQADVLSRARDSFAGVPLLHVPYQPTEIRGLDALASVADLLYGGRDPMLGQGARSPLRFEEVDGRPALVVRLAGAAGGEVDLRRSESDLVLTVGGWRRTIALPDFLVGRPVERAVLSDGSLRVIFGETIRAVGDGG